ncbi:MAG: M4 family metallopeptidase, partial [Bdellovibrionota bacterium]
MKHFYAVLFSLSLFLFPFTSFAQEMSQGQKIEIEKDDLRDRVYSVRIKDNTFGGGVNFSFSAPQITTRSSLILDYKELAKQYLATYGGHFGITDVATQFFEGEVTVDNFGMAHVRFPQAYQGVAVTNGEMIVHIRSNGALKTINGIFIKGLSGLNATPSITEGEATAVAASYWQLKYGVSYEVDDIALVIISPSELKNKDGKSYLSWRIRLRNDGEFLDENVFIDAHTANYITYESNIRAAHGEKTPIFRRVAELAPDGQWWLNGVFPEYPGYVFGRLEGRPARGPNPYVNDGKGSGPDTVYTRLNQVHKFFQNELGINGPDGNGGIFVAESGIAKGKNVTDAYTDITWCPSNGMFSNKLHFMFCGYSKLEDLIGHEYAHAVGWGTLKYAGESGAIEEAISDLTGYRFQKYLTGSTDWVCETQTEDELPFRNSKTPGVGTLDPSPVHWYDSNTDCSRMHIMSTVASHAAYLASEGGEREGCKVRAVGIERVHNVWFHAKLNYFPSTVTYNSSISYIMDACDDLYPNTVNPEEFNPICYQIKKSMLATKMDQRGYCNDKRKIYERAPSCDFCPDNPNKDDIGCSGNCDGEADLDSDGDGTPDCYDECPNDPDKVTAGRCGCGVPEDIVDLDDDTFWGAGSCPAIRNDCDDTKFDNTAPGEPEICGDNIDNDCDGLTDEGCEEEEPKPDPNYTEIISRLQGGSGYSNSPDISGDGRYIVFSSSGKMLGVTEPLKNLNVFLYDTKLNTYTLISKDNNGLELNGDAFNSRISKKGETVVFQLDTPPNKNGVSTSKIFVWRKEKGLLLLTNHGYRPSVSPDGRYVTYDVKEEEKNGGYNAVYIWDAEKKGVTGEIDPPSRVIENTPEKLVNGNSFSSEVSATGKYVVFCSDATNLVDEDKDGEKIFVRNMISKEIELVARLRKGSSKVCPAITIAISDDGRYITYSGLLASNTYAAAHIYLWDRDKYSNRDERDRWIDKTTLIDTEYAESGKTSFASSGASYDPNISGDGRYITFRSSATNLVESGSIGNLPKIFLYDKDTSKIELISTGLNGAIPNGAPLKSGVSDDGSIIVFDSRASNLVESILDINGQGEDVFAVYRDVCPEDPDKYSVGECGCGVPDTDSDGNGIADCNEESTSTLDEDEEGFLDECPYDPAKVFPGICGCGVPDTDSDGDGTPDCNDKCPNDPKKTEPGICGCGVSDIDTDKDGTPDCKDLCPKDPKKVSAGICGCGVPDIDSDKDGVPDCKDKCPKDPKKITAGVCGCGVPDIDTDKDGTPDCNDKCPNDPKKTKPGICGCGIPDIDSDKDGVPDCKDKCPKDPKKITAGVCGCGVPDIDTDKDGTPDCKDLCPKDPKKVSAGICGCGVPDIDSDKDGVPDCKDKCPNDPKKTLPGICGCGVSDIDSNKDGIPDCLGTPE